MRASRVMWARACLLVLALAASLAPSAGAQTVSVMTNSGDVLHGTLSGLAPILRLDDPTPSVGPGVQFAVPLSSVQQIWVDFPRVVIETTEQVLVGPFSAFSGMSQLLKIQERGELTQIPFTAIRQIAFNDLGFWSLPREWLGQQWLVQRVYVAGKETAATIGATSSAATQVVSAPAIVTTTPILSEPEDDIVWNGAVPAEVAASPAPSGELPWWWLLIGVALLFGLFILIPTG